MATNNPMLLAVMVVLFVNAAFAVAMVRFNEPLLPILYACFWAFYIVLYWRRRIQLRGRSRDDAGCLLGLGHAAVFFGAILCILFMHLVCSLPLPSMVFCFLLFSVALHTLYRIIVLPLEVHEGVAVEEARFDDAGGGRNTPPPVVLRIDQLEEEEAAAGVLDAMIDICVCMVDWYVVS
ncbi:hypothetical protein BS78_08G155500 [Paspalum vaginatum]|nr:hypothetical protein BS78_08G155500 [Paspalum vaginatum]